MRFEDRYSFFMVYMYIHDSLVMFVICFVYVVKRLEQLIKVDMALYKFYVLLLLFIINIETPHLKNLIEY